MEVDGSSRRVGSIRERPPDRYGRVSWEARVPGFIDPRRPVIKEKFSSKRAAAKAIDREVAAFERNERRPRTTRRARRVSDAVQAYLDERVHDADDPLAASTARSYRQAFRNQIRHAKANIGLMRVADVYPEDVQAWMSKLAKEGVPVSRRDYARRVLSAVMAREVELGNIASSPTAQVRKRRTKAGRAATKKSDPVLLPTWVEFSVLASHPERWEDRLLIALMGFSGLRWREATSLQTIDLWPDANKISVERVWMKQDASDGGEWVCEPVKAGNAETVSVPAPLMEALRTLAASRTEATQAGNLLFRADQRASRNGHQLIGSGNFRMRVWLPAREAAGLAPHESLPKLDPRRRGVKVKDLRAFAGSVLVDAGAQLTEVMVMLRHGEVRTTERFYVRAQERASDPARRALRADTNPTLPQRLDAVWAAFAERYDSRVARILTPPVGAPKAAPKSTRSGRSKRQTEGEFRGMAPDAPLRNVSRKATARSKPLAE